MPGKPPRQPDYDVAVIGSGLAGSTLAACLARNGVKTVIIDAGTHPRFAIGESTIPYTSMMMRLISERYDVPEIKWMTTFEAVQSKITSKGGVKRNFGFVYHREGQRQNPLESHSFPIPKITHTENHFFRQDLDSWMLTVAAKYGASLRQQARIAEVEFDADGVDVILENADTIRVKYVVDASGFRSVLADKFGLREEPTRLRHQARALFTHMVGVKPFEDTVPDVYDVPSKWSEGTLHHLFEGGWMWVIPFDNHVRSTNPLCSIGLNLDPRIHPVPENMTPEEEFRAFIAKYPNIAPQFENAVAVRDWVRTGRLQYSSKQTMGHRWCLTSHAAGFVDALFSRGLSNTMEIVNALTWRLIDAVKEDDFSLDRFEYVQELEQSMIDFNDDLVANAYTSFREYDLWDAWFRIWSLGQILATFEINRTYAKFADHRDQEALRRLAELAPDGSIPDYAPVRKLLAEVSQLCREVQDGHADPRKSAGQIMALLKEADFVPPAFGLHDPENRWFLASVPRVLKTLSWAKTTAPDEIGELVYDGFTLFMKKRFARDEFELSEELLHTIAQWPMVGRPFRTPAPK